MTYLLDTNILVFMIRGLKQRTHPNAQQRIGQAIAIRIFDRARKEQRAGHTVAISAITVAELNFGAWSSRHPAELASTQQAIAPFDKLPFDADACAKQYGRVRHLLESSGKPIGSFDLLIAAHGLALDATLVTNNVSEFSRVPGLICEDWTAN